MTNEELKKMAEKAQFVSSGAANWIGIDKSGSAFAYNSKPIRAFGDYWQVMHAGDTCWKIGKVNPPADFTKEIYEISKI